jgi:threonine dehydrogenase-like Zn-dependent dehydrogenase
MHGACHPAPKAQGNLRSEKGSRGGAAAAGEQDGEGKDGSWREPAAHNLAPARTSAEPGGVGLGDHPVRLPGPEEVEFRVALCGLCGSDVVVYDADPHFAWVRPGTVLGHESVGTVGRVGLLVPEGIAPGMRAVPVSKVRCGRCTECAAGRVEQCRRPATLGLGRHGTAAGRTIVPWHCLVPVPDGLPDTTAVLAEPASVAWRAVAEVAQVQADERVAVSTTRAIGLLAALIARSRGADVTMVGRPGPGHEAKRELADRLGLKSTTAPDPGRFDTWVEASGSGKQLATAMASLRPGGKLVLVAMYASGTPQPVSARARKDISILASYSSVRSDFDQAIEFLLTVPRVGEQLITLFPMDRAVEALRLTARAAATEDGRPLIKAVLRPGA